MSTNADNHKAQLTEIAKAIGAILGVPLALFTVVNSIIAQPITSLIVALTTAVLVSVWVILSRWVSITRIITAWLALAVVVLAGFVIWPTTMTVEGLVRNAAGNPVSNEKVLFFDRSDRRYETRTDAEGRYQFIDVPSGRYRVQVRTSEVEGETKGVLVRVVQQNLTVSQITPTASPTSVATITPNTPTATPIPPTNTPTPSVVESRMVALQTHHKIEDKNRYVTAMKDDWDWVIRAETTELKDFEKFTILCLDNGKVAFMTFHGRYVTAMGADWDWVLRAETSSLLAFEEFTLLEADTGKQKPCLEVFELFGQGNVRIALKTHHGWYVTAMDYEDDATGKVWDWVLRAETTTLSDWEKFTVTPLQ